MFAKIKQRPILSAIFVLWAIIIISIDNNIQIIIDYFAYFFVGITGAIFANSTGAGGGVVFVPFFNQLQIDNQTIVATSFAIQCCGMTAGAFTWYKHRQSVLQTGGAAASEWHYLPKALLATVLASIAGILTAQFLLSEYTSVAQNGLHLGFGIFSILLALCIYGSIPLLNKQAQTKHLLKIDLILLNVIAFAGGIITAWLSVGVGELVAVYLILRGFNITSAIAVAVILSAFTVWSAIGYHLFVSDAIYWHLLLFAGAGAIVGGIVAKKVVLYFSVIKLKIFFATWVLIMGAAGLIM
jgi:uncharacterized membrane protein YfcA